MRAGRAAIWWRAMAVGAVALTVLSSSPAVASTPVASDQPPLAHTDSGLVRGARSAGVDSFLGVPYAQPPLAERRWRAPAPAASWAGVRDATSYGNRCPAQASMNGLRSETEDCLYLNVQRPASLLPGRKLPVYVWIHGGGLTYGSSNQHDASSLARQADVVVVTINYRLGVFGFLSHPALTQDAGQSGNYGFLDQQAALRWVQRNIDGFGGDPHRVTLGGESAGGQSVCAHLSAPGSRGLFTQAIIQSASCPSQTVGQAETVGASIAQSLGCVDSATAARCLRETSAAKLVDATPYDGNGIMFVRDTSALPEDPAVAVREGRFARVPLMIGANRDEGRTWMTVAVGWTRQQYEAIVGVRFPGREKAVLSRYPWPAQADQFTAAYLAAAFITDAGLIGGIGGCANLDLTQAFARHTPTYAYRFDHRTGPGLPPDPPASYVSGAGHGAELAYIWPSFHWGVPIAPQFDAAERRLATDMTRYWGSFVHTGQPRAAYSARWPSFAQTGQAMSLRANGRSAPVPVTRLTAEHQCDFWTPHN